jgi:tetratricopeptide (TPR) repeat protein
MAHAGLADVYASMAVYEVMPPREAFGKSKPASERALVLDAELGEAYYALGTARTFFDWDFTAGESAFRKAIALNPSLAMAHSSLAYLLAVIGRPSEALAEAYVGRTLDPASVVVAFTVARAVMLTGRYEEALSEVRRALELKPGFGPACGALCELLSREGKHAEAAEASERYLAVVHRNPRSLAVAAATAFRAGRRGDGDERLQELRSCSMTTYVSPIGVAAALAARGDYGDALTWLERAVEERVSALVQLNVSSIWDPLRSDPRFMALTKRIGLPTVSLA